MAGKSLEGVLPGREGNVKFILRTLTILLVALSLPVRPLQAQAATTTPSVQPKKGESANSLFLGYTQHHYSSGAEGRETSLEWLRRLGTNVRMLAGGVESSIEDSQWRFGRLGLAMNVMPRTQLYVEGNVGKGTQGSREFQYRQHRGALTVELVKQTLYVEAEGQYINIDRSKGNVVKGGLVLTPRPPLRLGVAVHQSISGNLDSRYISGRADWTISQTTLLAGFSKGRTRPEMFQVFDTSILAASRDSEEYFAGVQLPMARQKLTVVFSSLEFEDFKRRSVVFNWRVPY
jgi:hypothetical protein